MKRLPILLVLPALLMLLGTACGSDDGGDDASNASTDDVPTVVVTTSILGDVVENVVGDAAQVEVLMPPGVDPHEFELSAADAAGMQEADAIVANGLGFEAGMADAIDAAAEAGVPLYEVAPDVDPLPLAEGSHEHAEEGGDHAEEGGDHHAEEGDGSGLDPHVFTDPTRMADAAGNIADALAEDVPALDTPEVRDQAAAYADEILAADADIEDELSAIPEDKRVLVTNHEVFSYFADRYGFEVVGTVIPGGSTLAEPSSQELSDLADTIREYDVPAIFADATSPTDLANALADEEDLDVEVVSLYSESLGEPGSGADTYIAMINTNATAITDALTSGS